MRSRSASIRAALSSLLLCGACESTAPGARPLAHARAPAVAAPVPASAAALAGSAAPPAAAVTSPPTPREAPAQAWPVLPVASGAHDFCPARLRALAADACFVLPEKPVTTLLIYLHGIVPPTRDSVQKTNLADVVANASERAGVVALLPRGEQGFAPASTPRWWGWPTTKQSYERHAGEFIERVQRKRAELEELLAVKFERVYLAGSSSGAYFVASVLLHGDMPEVAGYAVLSGGSGYTTPALAKLPPSPVYVGFGQHDSVARPARALGAELAALGWPVKVAAHPTGHGAREIYLDEAFDFWREQPESPTLPETGPR